jgi:hypothetical protein
MESTPAFMKNTNNMLQGWQSFTGDLPSLAELLCKIH